MQYDESAPVHLRVKQGARQVAAVPDFGAARGGGHCQEQEHGDVGGQADHGGTGGCYEQRSAPCLFVRS